MLICEMAAYYKKQGKSLVDVIDGLYAEYGCYLNTTLDFYFEGASGMDKMSRILTNLRDNAPAAIAGEKVVHISDYLTHEAKNLVSGDVQHIDLPTSNVLAYTTESGNCAIVRPSGTEPKIKIYITAIGKDFDEAHRITDRISADMKGYLE